MIYISSVTTKKKNSKYSKSLNLVLTTYCHELRYRKDIFKIKLTTENDEYRLNSRFIDDFLMYTIADHVRIKNIQDFSREIQINKKSLNTSLPFAEIMQTMMRP